MIFIQRLSSFSTEMRHTLIYYSFCGDFLKPYLIADVNLNSRLEVVKDFFKVPCPGSSQVTGIAIRLKREKNRM